MPAEPTITSTSIASSPTVAPVITAPVSSASNSIFPLCQLEPEVGYVGSAIRVKAESLPVNHLISIHIGNQPVADGMTDNLGKVDLSVVIPTNIPPGLSQVSVYAEGTAVAAECVVDILPVTSLSPTIRPVLTPTTLSTSSPELRDSISIWRSYVGLQGQQDHLIFHVITKDASFIPRSIQILDAETGQVTNSFPLQDSPIPNLCTATSVKGQSYYRTEDVFFEDLPQDFLDRLMGTAFTYLIEMEQPTGERVSIVLTDPPGGCTNLVQ